MSDRAVMTDSNGDWIFGGEDYYQTACGPLRTDGVAELKEHGDIETIMHVLWREDELGDKSEETLARLREEISEMTVDEFQEQMQYAIWTAGDPGYMEDYRYEKQRDRALGI